MQNLIKAARGTQDTLPNDVYKIQYVEKCAAETARVFGYKEIRTPVFEHTELFNRSVGDTTDVVQKEMYTFNDKGGRSITLRPEGTAGAARAVLEHGLYNDALPQKIYYFTSCYRYEKPQAGRLREFHQFGIECIGASEPSADAEIISLASYFFDSIGIKDLQLEMNSIGCPECRAKYNAALKTYFESHKDELCETCLGRLDRNPMRILDCKSPICSKIAEGAPVMLEYLCDECSSHFESVKKTLDAMGIQYKINPKIVRGLDYYTKTVFEFVSNEIGAQGTVCGGGRYDGLMDELGGVHIPSLGFAIGLERLMLLMEAQNCIPEDDNSCELYLIAMGGPAQLKVAELASRLREEGVCTQYDLTGRSVKAQMKHANKIGARKTVVIGDSELESGKAVLKDMYTKEQTEIELDNIVEEYKGKRLGGFMSGIIDSMGGIFKNEK